MRNTLSSKPLDAEGQIPVIIIILLKMFVGIVILYLYFFFHVKIVFPVLIKIIEATFKSIGVIIQHISPLIEPIFKTVGRRIQCMIKSSLCSKKVTEITPETIEVFVYFPWPEEYYQECWLKD